MTFLFDDRIYLRLDLNTPILKPEESDKNLKKGIWL